MVGASRWPPTKATWRGDSNRLRLACLPARPIMRPMIPALAKIVRTVPRRRCRHSPGRRRRKRREFVRFRRRKASRTWPSLTAAAARPRMPRRFRRRLSGAPHVITRSLPSVSTQRRRHLGDHPRPAQGQCHRCRHQPGTCPGLHCLSRRRRRARCHPDRRRREILFRRLGSEGCRGQRCRGRSWTRAVSPA